MKPLEFLRMKLKELTWAQMVELGKQTDVSAYTMNNIVNSRHAPRYEIVEVLVEAFGQTLIVWPKEGSVMVTQSLEDMEGMAQ